MSDHDVTRLLPCELPSPLACAFTTDDVRILADVEIGSERVDTAAAFEKAGPRAKLHFEPEKTQVGIVTCGGLSPGINNAVRSLALELHHRYRVPKILGFRYGFEGLVPGVAAEPIVLRPETVRHVHRLGGSFLGTSRGRRDVGVMVDTLERLGLDVLFLVGGNGTLQGAHAIHEELVKRHRHIGVVALPKTIDDDVPYLDKTFGFETAVDMGRIAIDAAHVEASSARNGIGIVKLMGRDSGFIAASATLASAEANFCLLPEFPFVLDGPSGLLAAVERRLHDRGHAVLVVAEGCAASLVREGSERDASGNPRYASAELDIGPRLRDALAAHFRAAHVDVTIKYIDPSYTIRAAPANATDALYCAELGRHAAHAAMAGRTDVMVGRFHGAFVHVPIPLAISRTRRVDEALFQAVREVTGQPRLA